MTLLTDYGYKAGFVGTLHAVAEKLAPGSRVIDLDHSIPPGDVRLGALRLERLMRFVPSGVHVGVVDPGVGGRRRGVALSAGDHRFVGPDNGLLVWAAEAAGGIDEAVALEDDAWFLPERSRTFDGRDVFVPVAARLLGGVQLRDIGPDVPPGSLERADRPVSRHKPDGTLEAEVVQVDGFGNIQLSAGPAELEALGAAGGSAVAIDSAGARVVATVGSTFSDVEVGGGVLLLDSDGQLAYSVNRGRADRTLHVEPGAHVTLRALP